MLLFSFCDCPDWCLWLLYLLSGLLGLLAGWLLWGRFKKLYESLEKEVVELKAQISALEGDLNDCNAKRAALDSELTLTQGRIREMESNVQAQAASAAAPKTKKKDKSGKSTAQSTDNLQKVEGIGPKIESLLQEDGISSWRVLAECSKERIQEVLDNAGPKYKLADPSTWPKQAEMCADGRWDDLKEYQDFLLGGK